MHYPLMLALKPSRTVMASVAVAHGAAALTLFFALRTRDSLGIASVALPVSLVVLACWATLFWSAARAIRAERSKRGLQLVLAEDGSVRCDALLGERAGRIEGSAADFGWVVCVRVRVQDAPPASVPLRGLLGRRLAPLMLVPGNVAHASDWRGLRIWLRHKAFARQAD